MKIVTADYSWKHKDNFNWNEVIGELYTVESTTDEEAIEKVRKYIESKSPSYSDLLIDDISVATHIK